MNRSLLLTPCLLLSVLAIARAGELSPAEFEQHRKNANRLAEAERWEEAGAELSSLAVDDSRKAVEFLAGFAAANPDRRVWEAARDGLAAMQGEKPVARMCEWASTKKQGFAIQLLMVDACARRSDGRSAQALIAALASKQPSVLRTAIEAAKFRKLKEAVGPLAAALARTEGDDGLTAELAETALREITGETLRGAKAWSILATTGAPPKEKLPENVTRARPKFTFFGKDLVTTRVMFVIDVSESMREADPVPGEEPPEPGARVNRNRVRLTRALVQLARALKGLPDYARFGILAYSGVLYRLDGGYALPEGMPRPPRARPHRPEPWFTLWKKKLQPANDRSRQSAYKFMKKLRPKGSTFTLKAMRLALGLKDIDTIVLLSDGSPTEIEGKTAREFMPADTILTKIDTLNRFRRVRIHTFGVGALGGAEERAFGAFMQKLADRNRGTFTAVE